MSRARPVPRLKVVDPSEGIHYAARLSDAFCTLRQVPFSFGARLRVAVRQQPCPGAEEFLEQVCGRLFEEAFRLSDRRLEALDRVAMRRVFQDLEEALGVAQRSGTEAAKPLLETALRDLGRAVSEMGA